MNEPHVYEIWIEGLISDLWSSWFDGLGVDHADDETILRGRLADQAALLGVLSKIHSLNLKIIGVIRMPPTTEPGTSDRE